MSEKVPSNMSSGQVMIFPYISNALFYIQLFSGYCYVNVYTVPDDFVMGDQKIQDVVCRDDVEFTFRVCVDTFQQRDEKFEMTIFGIPYSDCFETTRIISGDIKWNVKDEYNVNDGLETHTFTLTFDGSPVVRISNTHDGFGYHSIDIIDDYAKPLFQADL